VEGASGVPRQVRVFLGCALAAFATKYEATYYIATMRARVQGPALSPLISEALTAMGVTLGGAGPTLVTACAAPSGVPTPWLWLPPATPSLEEAARVLLEGAEAVIPLDGEAAAAAIAAQLTALLARARVPASVEGFPATSEAAKRVLGALERAAQTSMAVLLTGETGTGKDVAARQLHAWSARAAKRFVPINCAAVPNELIEGELFGYVRGAFSGAVADYEGQLQAAAGGTVFLDEVDDTPKTLQVKLLRVLEDHVVSRLGENRWRPVDFRVVAATNRDLRKLVRRGEFGGDLYQRLAIVQIQLPPLRDRGEDVPGLSHHFVERYYQEEPTAQRVTRISPLAMAALRRYPWPGNIRELRNVVFQSLVGKRCGEELLLSDLPEPVIRGAPDARSDQGDRDHGDLAEAARRPVREEDDGAPASAAPSIIHRGAIARAIESGRMNLRAAVEELEREALRLALVRAGGSPTGAARLLGEVGRGRARDPSGTVRAMMRRHQEAGVGAPSPRPSPSPKTAPAPPPTAKKRDG
jgi:DNA-binding NtrC family response regulator